MRLLLILLLTVGSAVAQPENGRAEADRLYTLGAALYAEGDFRGAAAAFEGAAATGWTSPDLELALGAAHFEAGAVGRAVLHFERARRLAPQSADVARNLRLARAAVDTPPAPLTQTDAVARWLAATFGVGAVAGFAFVLYLAVIGLIGWRVWTGAGPPWWRRALLVLVPLLLFSTVAAVGTTRYVHRTEAVVLRTSDVLTRPSEGAGTAETAAEGVVLRVTEARGAWRAVRLPDGTTGWIAATAIEEV